MATLLRFARPSRLIAAQLIRSNKYVTPTCCISTTKKPKAGGAGEITVEKTEELRQLEEHFADTDETKLKNWVSHSWSDTDRDADQFIHNMVMFFTFSLLVCFGIFTIAYFPDYKLRDWATREAYLELDRREKKGLPLIDPYVVPPEQVELPSEEEIGDEDIII